MSSATQEVKPGEIAFRGLITLSIMLATIMQVLDTTIANVALPHMQGSLTATQDQITWVLTSYIVASAIMTRGPLRAQTRFPSYRGRLYHKLSAMWHGKLTRTNGFIPHLTGLLRRSSCALSTSHDARHQSA